MVYNTRNYWVFFYSVHRPVFYILENTTIRKLDLVPSFYPLFYPSSTHALALSQFVLHVFLLSPGRQ
jgi:hypothetical protein